MLFVRRSVLLSSLVAGALLGGGSPLAGQCLGPDSLDLGPCCAPAFATIPAFPAGSIPGLGICWSGCSVASTNPLKVSWTAPTASICTMFTSTLTVSDGSSGQPLLTGTLELDYTRTWEEIDPSGISTQVWRFVAKADLSPTPGVVPNCPMPSCIGPAGPHPTAFFYGYMDYAGCVAGGPFENVLVLYHAADRFIHPPGLSSLPGVFHPTGAYGIVAPHGGLQTFIPGNAIAPGGPLVYEASRDGNIPGTILCSVEDKVINGNMIKLGAGCIATLSLNPKQQTLRNFSGTTTCVAPTGVNGGWASLAIAFPILPWLHMVSTSIGTWANPNVYPGKESCWVDEGLFVHQDACLGDFVELKYGGSTKGGFQVVLPIPPIVTNFTDLADNWSAPITGPFTFPIMGAIQPTDRLLYVNEP